MPFSIVHHRVSFAIDIGAEVNLLSLATFKSLTAQTHTSRWPLCPPLDILTAVQGAKLTVYGIVTFPVNLNHSSRSVKIDFYVVDAFQLPSNRLIIVLPLLPMTWMYFRHVMPFMSTTV